MAAVRHLGFLKVANFNCQSGLGGEPVQIGQAVVVLCPFYGSHPPSLDL